jgi:hypothetical protein
MKHGYKLAEVSLSLFAVVVAMHSVPAAGDLTPDPLMTAHDFWLTFRDPVSRNLRGFSALGGSDLQSHR